MERHKNRNIFFGFKLKPSLSGVLSPFVVVAVVDAVVALLVVFDMVVSIILDDVASDGVLLSSVMFCCSVVSTITEVLFLLVPSSVIEVSSVAYVMEEVVVVKLGEDVISTVALSSVCSVD